MKINKKTFKKISFILDERILSVAILIIICVTFSFANNYVSGRSEIDWARAGYTYTNYNLGMFVMLAIAAGGTVWIIYKYAKRAKILVSTISCLVVALCMAISPIFYWILPIVVIIAFAMLKLDIVKKMKGRRVNNDISNRK